MKRIIIALTAYSLISAPLRAQDFERPKKPAISKKDNPFEGTSLSISEQLLFAASASGDNATVSTLLLTKKVSPNIQDKNGNTPLHYAKGLPVAALLVENGADVDAQNNDGLAPLHIHTVLGRLPIIDYLLGKGADASITDNNKVTPLHLATMISYFEAPQARLALGAGAVGSLVAGRFITRSALSGSWTALLEAVAAAYNAGATQGQLLAMKGSLQSTYIASGRASTAAIAYVIAEVDIAIRNFILKNLIVEGGADVNARDIDGNTPLQYLASGPVLKPANRHGGVIMAEHLMARGANKTLKNNDGQTPYDIAVENNRTNLLPFLATKEQTVKGVAGDVGKTIKGKVKRAKTKTKSKKQLAE